MECSYATPLYVLSQLKICLALIVLFYLLGLPLPQAVLGEGLIRGHLEYYANYTRLSRGKRLQKCKPPAIPPEWRPGESDGVSQAPLLY